MKIELEVDNLKRFIDAFNNALLTYKDLVNSIILACEIPKKFEPLKSLDDEVLLQRKSDLISVYEQLLEIEKSVDKN